MSYDIFQDTNYAETTFVEFYGIISAIPRLWKHLINTCHNLIYKENNFIHQLQIDSKPCKYLYWQYIDNQRLPWACNLSLGSTLLSITTQLHCGGHFGGRAWLLDTILEEDHRMTIPSKCGSNWATGSRQDDFWCEFTIGFYVKLSSAVQPSWSEGGTTRHTFGKEISND
jgi:hypothetical protein